MTAELLTRSGELDARISESDQKPKAYGLKPEPTFVCTGCGGSRETEDGVAPKCCAACGCGTFRVVVGHGATCELPEQAERSIEHVRSYLHLARENAVIALEEMGRQWNLAKKSKMGGLKRAIRTMEQAADEIKALGQE